MRVRVRVRVEVGTGVYEGGRRERGAYQALQPADGMEGELGLTTVAPGCSGWPFATATRPGARG
jgi:hypothetical protein